jgi:F-type H+-transporting ATPase subunit a
VNLSSDQLVLWQHGFLVLNGTIAYTWVTIFVMALGAKLVTRRLAIEGQIPRWQCSLEIVVTAIETQIKEVGLARPERYLAFLGTLFLFIAVANLGTLVPGYQPPTGSLSTTAALALCVFIAVPLFGIREQGFAGYMRSYMEPTVLMLPFNIISELSRTLALAVRLFGNMMSGVMIIGILLTITPYFFPIAMTALGLLTGTVQAYIFSIMAAVYIAAATLVRKAKPATALPAPDQQNQGIGNK